MRAADPRHGVVHSWSCPPSRRVVVEAIETQPTGQALVVQRCQGCGGSDQGDGTTQRAPQVEHATDSDHHRGGADVGGDAA